VTMQAEVIEMVADGQIRLALPGVRVINLTRRSLDCQVLEGLRERLESGLNVLPDPRRANFYQASLDGYQYYFHVLDYADRPSRVFLLSRRG